MKVLAENNEEGLLALMGEEITVISCRYIYAGKLVVVNSTCIKLEGPKIVYNTGCFTEKEWADAQALPHKYFYLSTSAIESFGRMKG